MFRYFLAILVLSSCVKDTPVVINLPQTIVVNCILTKSSVQTLKLNYCSNLGNGNFYKEVVEATVKLYNDSIEVGTFTKNGYANWELPYTPLEGKTCRVEVTVPGFAKISATTTMPFVSNVTKLVANDNGTNKNIRQYKGSTTCWIFAIISASQFPDSIILEPSAPSEKDKLIDQIATNNPYADKFNQQGNLLDVVRDADLPAYNYYIRTTVNVVAPDSIDFRLQGCFLPVAFIIFRNASSEYDAYLKSSLQKMEIYTDKDDPGKWFDENKIYSNIINGTGIFAAYSDRVLLYNSFLPFL